VIGFGDRLLVIGFGDRFLVAFWVSFWVSFFVPRLQLVEDSIHAIKYHTVLVFTL
jgi:hypothetical protein